MPMKKQLRSLVAEMKDYLAHSDQEALACACAMEHPSSPAASKVSSVPARSAAVPGPESVSQKPAPVAVVKREDPFSAPAQPRVPSEKFSGDKADKLAKIAEKVESCRQCSLGLTRIKAVFGVGNPESRIMFVGEGPGYYEDRMGEPFVGKAGQLLDKILAAMTLSRKAVYIANIVKCHPMINPNNPDLHSNDRPPTPVEMSMCRQYINSQIEIIRPDMIVALGSVAAKNLLDSSGSLSSMRGRVHTLPGDIFGTDKQIKVVATYHPAALLRNPNWKKGAWEDMQMVMSEMGIPLPSAGSK